MKDILPSLLFKCLFFVTAVHTQDIPICPIGWEEFDDMCYFCNHAARVNYAGASNECRKMGAHLTSIHSMEEQDFLADRTKDDTDRTYHFYYIGLNDMATENTFVWSDDTSLGFIHWGKDQPNDHQYRQDCVGLEPKEDDTWVDIDCSTTHAYICKRDKGSCVKPLGMKDGTIQDNQIRASSEYNEEYGAHKARLDGIRSWYADDNDVDQWILVDFGTLRRVSGIVTQGDSEYSSWVTRYKVQYTEDGISRQFITDVNRFDAMVFIGNSDRNSYATSLFPSTINATRIGIRPTSWNDDISIRFEILGCEVSEHCVQPLGMKDGTIQDNQIRASSVYDYRYPAHKARLDGIGTWSANTEDDNPYILVDFGTIRRVSGIVTQGDPAYKSWVTSYKVQYWEDGFSWQYVTDVNQMDATVFTGNSDKNTYATSLFPSTINATRIRIRPTDWKAFISMRFEILGCQVQYSDTTKPTTESAVTMVMESRTPERNLAPSTSGNKQTAVDTAPSTPEKADSEMLGNQKSSSNGVVIGVSIAIFVLLVAVISGVLFVLVRRRQQHVDSSESQAVIQLDGPYGDTATNIITHQPTDDMNTYEGVDHANYDASEGKPPAKDGNECYQNVPGRPGDVPEINDDTYQDIRDENSIPNAVNEDVYQDVRDTEYDYASVDKERFTKPDDEDDLAISRGDGSVRLQDENGQEGWADNDIYGRSDEDQPKRQDGEDNDTEGWVDNSIYATSDNL